MPEITSDRIYEGCTVLGEKLAKDKPEYIERETEMSDRNGVVVEKENSVMCPICKSKRIFNLRIDNDWSYGTGIYYPANDEENYSDEELNYNATDRPDIDLYHCLNCDLLW